MAKLCFWGKKEAESQYLFSHKWLPTSEGSMCLTTLYTSRHYAVFYSFTVFSYLWITFFFFPLKNWVADASAMKFTWRGSAINDSRASRVLLFMPQETLPHPLSVFPLNAWHSFRNRFLLQRCVDQTAPLLAVHAGLFNIFQDPRSRRAACLPDNILIFPHVILLWFASFIFIPVYSPKTTINVFIEGFDSIKMKTISYERSEFQNFLATLADHFLLWLLSQP